MRALAGTWSALGLAQRLGNAISLRALPLRSLRLHFARPGLFTAQLARSSPTALSPDSKTQPGNPVAPESAQRSAWYRGPVRHRRFFPRSHQLEARTLWLFVDLGEWQRGQLEERLPAGLRLDTRWPAGLRRKDLLGPPGEPLDEAVRSAVSARLGFRPAGPIGLLTLPAALGLGFNPVSFYYCWNALGSGLEAVLAEITNTPWLERHAYALDLRQGLGAQRFPKRFHVSPFLDIDIEYLWAFGVPGQRLSVHMEDHQAAPGKPQQPVGLKLFDATMLLERQELSAPLSFADRLRLYLQPPLVVLAIYTHAAWLYLKRVPFYTHPRKRTSG